MTRVLIPTALVIAILPLWACGGTTGSSPTGPTGTSAQPAGATIINVVRENGAQSFSPDPATVPVGEMVVWHNIDTVTHRVVLNDGTPLKSVEVRVDEGPWQPAKLDPATSARNSWKLFTYLWEGATPGEHTLVSRVTDTTGHVQPTEKDLENKKSFLEDNSQYPRKVMIS